MCGEGNRKSCLWKLTPEGLRKFQEEAQALPEEALDLVRQSMSEPGTFQRAGENPAKRRASETSQGSRSGRDTGGHPGRYAVTGTAGH